MEYKYKEYKHIFDTPAAMEQEGAIVNKIMDLLNKNKYDNIDEFIEKNPSYQDFLKNNELEIVMKHFGNTLNEADFKRILESMVELTKNKNDFDKDNIKTTTIDDNQYNSYKGNERNYYFDNSNNDMNIERQIEELQPTQNEFQTNDKEKNTENMMRELEDSKKESLNFKYLNEFDLDSLNEEEKKMWNTVANYQLNTNGILRIDIEKKVIIDENENIMKIENRDGEFTISGQTNEVTFKNEEKENTHQKKLMPNTNTIYSNNN